MNTPPLHSNDAETGVLGGLILMGTHHAAETGHETVASIRELLPPEAFFFAGNRTVYEKICGLSEAGKAFDLLSLIQGLRDAGHETLGGHVGNQPCASMPVFLSELLTNSVTAANLGYHAGIVREKFVRRELECACRHVTRRLHEEQDGDVQAILDDAQTRILSVAESNAPRDNFRRPKDGVMTALARLQEAYENRGGITGLPSGLMDLDRMTTGWKPGQVIIVAGSTGMGKTAFMLQCAEHLAVDCGVPVAYFSLEMDYDELCARALHGRARVSLQRARDGHLADRDFARLTAAATGVAEAPLYIDDWSGLNHLEMRARARHAVRKLGCRAIFGDYLQLVSGTDERENDRTRELAQISRAIKITAKTLKVPIIFGAQLNRKPDERSSQVVVNPWVTDDDGKPMRFKRHGVPQLGDLRECGAISMDADIVLHPYRPWYWSKSDDDRVSTHVEWAQLLVSKQRNGPVGPVYCQFIDDETRFVTLPDSNGNERENLYTTAAAKQQAGYTPQKPKMEDAE